MISVWTILLALLLFEITCTVILVLNLFILRPIQKLLVQTLRFLFSYKGVKIAFWVIIGLTIYSFWYSYSTEQHLEAQLHQLQSGEVLADAQKSLQLQVRIFREQRNRYISGFFIFHALVLWRIVRLTLKHYETERTAIAAVTLLNKSDKKPEKEIKIEQIDQKQD